MKCYSCGGKCFEKVEGVVRDMPKMPILKCGSCGLVFLKTNKHISNGFYEKSKMRKDEPLMKWDIYIKECEQDDQRRYDWIKKDIIDKSVLDFGCGAGGFLLKAKETAKYCAGIEKDSDLRSVLKGLDFDVYSDASQLKRKFDVITLFHVLEHLKDPKAVLKKLSKLLNNKGVMIIEVPNADDALISLYKSKAFSRFTYWSCHLYLFNSINLKKVIEDAKLKINFIGQIQRYPLSNHLYWLSFGKPGGHKIWDFLNSKQIDSAYEKSLAKIGKCDTLIASARK